MSDSQNPYRPMTQDHADWEIRREWRRDEEEQRFMQNWLGEQERIQSTGSQVGHNTSLGSETKAAKSSSNESGLFEFGDWFVQHIWPLRMIEQAGIRMARPGKTVRIVAMLAGAVLLAVLTTPEDGAVAWPWAHALLVDIAGDSSLLLAVGIGAFLGWWAPTAAGALLGLTAHLTGFAIGLLLIAGLLWVVYSVITAGLAE